MICATTIPIAMLSWLRLLIGAFWHWFRPCNTAKLFLKPLFVLIAFKLMSGFDKAI
jgi:hypothetical protein